MQPTQPPLPPQQQHSRIDLGELKSQIGKRLGPERAHRYFKCLNKLLANKLSKTEFNKLCLSSLGRENVLLHNQLIRSILHNAFNAKVPPPAQPVHDKGPAKPIGAQRDGGFNSFPAAAPPPPVWSNGDVLPTSPPPRKCRSGSQNRRIKDRTSSLATNGRAEVAEVGVGENGEVNPCDLKRPIQNHQGGPAEQPAKRSRIERLSPNNRASVHSKGLAEVVAVDDKGDVQQRDDFNSIRGPLRAPLGIPFCPASVGGARKCVPLKTSISTSSGHSSNYDSGDLCHTEGLRQRMEKIAESQGLGGVTIECANLLNNGLDAYLKQLIKSCVELTGARSAHQPIKQLVHKQQAQGKLINGVWPGNHMHVQNSGVPLDGPHDPRNQCPTSLQDFKVAMELNPQQLGEDWPLLLEKICIRSFED